MRADGGRQVKVVELSRGIAAAYCGRLLSQAGAGVTVVEPPEGHPLRRRRPTPAATPGALWAFLSDGKRSASAADQAELTAGADVVIDELDTSASVSDRPGLLHVTLSPFGLTGPWRDRPATEFVIQAMCGSTGRRGLPGRPPVFSGGAPVDFAAGSYAAAAISCFWWLPASRNDGIHLDISLLETGAVTMHAFVTLDASFRGDKGRPPRTTQIPSIEPTADGYIGVSTITAQQFTDFLRLVGRPDLADDESLLVPAERQRRREEVIGAIRSWTTQRTTDEIVDLATALRIPVAPIGNGENLPLRDHFVERGVFSAADHGVIRPRRPYRITDPGPGEGEGSPTRWRGPDDSGGPDRPLAGLRVADFTAFWAGPSATHLLAALGAEVVKVESPARPDGMRFTSSHPLDEDWLEWSAVFHGVNANKRSVALDLRDREDLRRALGLIRWADVVIENFSPRVLDDLDLAPDTIARANPEAILVRMPAFGLTGPWRDRTGFAMTVEQASGLAWQTGYRDGPPMDVGGVCDPVCGMHAVVALMQALHLRSTSGHGYLVEVPLVEVALNMAAEQILQFSSDGSLISRDSNRGPEGAPQGIYPAPGEDRWVALSVRDETDWAALVGVLGSPEWMSGLVEREDRRREDQDLLDQALAAWTAERPGEESVAILLHAGIPAAEVMVPAEVADNPQLRSRRFFERLDHPVVGVQDIPSLPLRIAGRDEGWYRTPAPTVGQHSQSIGAEILDVYTEV